MATIHHTSAAADDSRAREACSGCEAETARSPEGTPRTGVGRLAGRSCGRTIESKGSACLGKRAPPTRRAHARGFRRRMQKLRRRAEGAHPRGSVRGRRDARAADARAAALAARQRGGDAGDRRRRLRRRRVAVLAALTASHRACCALALARRQHADHRSRVLLRPKPEPADLLLPVGVPLLGLLLHDAQMVAQIAYVASPTALLLTARSPMDGVGVVVARRRWGRWRVAAVVIRVMRARVERADRAAVRRGAHRPADAAVQQPRLSRAARPGARARAPPRRPADRDRRRPRPLQGGQRPLAATSVGDAALQRVARAARARQARASTRSRASAARSSRWCCPTPTSTERS